MHVRSSPRIIPTYSGCTCTEINKIQHTITLKLICLIPGGEKKTLRCATCVWSLWLIWQHSSTKTLAPRLVEFKNMVCYYVILSLSALYSRVKKSFREKCFYFSYLNIRFYYGLSGERWGSWNLQCYISFPDRCHIYTNNKFGKDRTNI